MKAIVVRKTGDVDALEWVTDHPTPPLPPGHVLVQNVYAGLNFIDTYHRSGLYKRDLPFVAGQEGGGVVTAVADDIATGDKDDENTIIKVGDRVVYMAFGSYAEYTAVPVSKVVKVPEGVDTDLAVACMVQGLTAHYLVTSAHANVLQNKGDWCLIFSVSSGTGQWAAQMAKLKGYRVVGTCSKGKEELGKDVCDELIVVDTVPGKSYSNYESVDISGRVMEITQGKGVKCVLDGVGKATIDISLAVLAVRGILVTFGNASGAVPPFSLLKLAGKSLFVSRPKLADYVATREELNWRAAEVFGWLKSGQLRVSIDTTFPLEKAKEGHLYLEGGKSKGKILFQI